ncbi:uncharacterized protein P884DRAFT_91225 [Thermothelomyces heterothallicus CBS 202.75]|uniref:uncharacterized protein n=1 Tax=Thermothelomyces heterothallicus CBS 202.75 TaxID=1149848 RepID=UPI0037449CCC
MSGNSEVEQLRAALAMSEQQNRALKETLNRVQSATSSNMPGVRAGHGDQVPRAANPQLTGDGLSGGTSMPYTTTNATGPRAKHASQDQSRPMKRSKTTHATGSSTIAPMVRSRSNVPRPTPGSGVFVCNSGQITQPATWSSLSVAGSNSIGSYFHQDQALYPVDAFAQGPAGMAGPSQHPELGLEMAVDEFLMTRDNAFSTTSPIDIPCSVPPFSQEVEQFPGSSLPSAYGSLTSGPSIETAPMSRQNSSMNDAASAIAGDFNDMVRIQSQQSSKSYRPSPIASQPPLLGKRAPEGSGVIVMQGGSFSYAHPSSAPTQSPFSQHQHAMKPSLSQSSIRSTSSTGPSAPDAGGLSLAQHLSMERSVSKDSVKSSSSLKHRAKEALARQNYAAKSRQLQPKPAVGAVKHDTADPANKGKAGKTAITKTKYERPRHPKVLCGQCNEHPDGFRGEHELRRHTEAKHKSMVKKWICRDPDLYGIPHSETAVKPLKDCKQCSQNKQYGAYYNAAAHLRRTHFNVKARKGAAGSKNGNGQGKTTTEEEREKRGGKGGGDWPSMNELKQWMVEVTVPMDQPGALVPDGTESVGAVDTEDLTNEFSETQYNNESQAGFPMGTGAWGAFDDIANLAGLGEGLGQTSVDVPGPGLFGDLDSQLSDPYCLNGPAMFSAPPLQGMCTPMPTSSAGFDYENSADPSARRRQQQQQEEQQQQQQQQSTAASSAASSALISGNSSHGYTSLVSSTATLAQANVYMDQLLPPTHMHASRDNVPDLPFDLAIAAGQ